MKAGNKVVFKQLMVDETYREYIVVEMRSPRVLVKEANPTKEWAFEPTFVYAENELEIIAE